MPRLAVLVLLSACAFAGAAHAAPDGARPMRDVLELAATIGPRKSGTEGDRRAVEYVRREMEAAGLQVSLQEVATVPEADAERAVGSWNVLGRLEGTTPDLIVVAAHHDSRSVVVPGANDDASGLAVLLEVARATAARPRRTGYLFASFCAEEEGLIGSRFFARGADLSHVRAVIALELLGRGGILVGPVPKPPPPWAQEALLRAARETGARGVVTRPLWTLVPRFADLPYTADHESFLEQGIPAGLEGAARSPGAGGPDPRPDRARSGGAPSFRAPRSALPAGGALRTGRRRAGTGPRLDRAGGARRQRAPGAGAAAVGALRPGHHGDAASADRHVGRHGDRAVRPVRARGVPRMAAWGALSLVGAPAAVPRTRPGRPSGDLVVRPEALPPHQADHRPGPLLRRGPSGPPGRHRGRAAVRLARAGGGRRHSHPGVAPVALGRAPGAQAGPGRPGHPAAPDGPLARGLPCGDGAGRLRLARAPPALRAPPGPPSLRALRGACRLVPGLPAQPSVAVALRPLGGTGGSPGPHRAPGAVRPAPGLQHAAPAGRGGPPARRPGAGSGAGRPPLGGCPGRRAARGDRRSGPEWWRVDRDGPASRPEGPRRLRGRGQGGRGSRGAGDNLQDAAQGTPRDGSCELPVHLPLGVPRARPRHRLAAQLRLHRHRPQGGPRAGFHAAAARGGRPRGVRAGRLRPRSPGSRAGGRGAHLRAPGDDRGIAPASRAPPGAGTTRPGRGGGWATSLIAGRAL
ncbi:MAG: hypothetical protein DMF50_05370 [Acidobacteria bacterium]|nr:MAG: hypothetical protein DMF50_05370 [Acidobacteriota bacterium]